MTLLSVAGMPVGTQVTDTTGQTWVLAVSSTGPDGTHLAVNGDPSLRWLQVAAGISVNATLTGAGTVGSPLGVAVPLDAGTLVTLAAPQTNITIPIAGDTDGSYWCTYYLVSTANQTITLNPNAIANGASYVANLDGSSSGEFAIGVADANGAKSAGSFTFRSKSGGTRVFNGSFMDQASGGSTDIHRAIGFMPDTSTVLTSLVFTGAFGAGSYVLLRKQNTV